MRQTVIELTPMDGGFGPLDRLLVEDPDIQRQTLNQINLLNDGTAVVLCELGGAIDRIEQAFEHDSSPLAYQISKTKNGLLVYLHYQPEEATVETLALLEEHEIIVDMPIEFTSDGGLRVTVFGEENAVQAAAASIPDTIEMRSNGLASSHRTTGLRFPC